MEVWYDLITKEKLDIDFEDIYNYVIDENGFDARTALCDIFEDFANNTEYYIQQYYTGNFIEDDNQWLCEDIVDKWEEWLKEKFNVSSIYEI